MKPTQQKLIIPIGEVGANGKVYLIRPWSDWFTETTDVTHDAQTLIDNMEADSFASDVQPTADIDMAPYYLTLEPVTDLSGRLEALESLVAHLMDKIEDLEGAP